MPNREILVSAFVLVLGLCSARSQDVSSYRIITVTLNTSSPTQLAIDGSRLIWRDTNLNDGTYFLRYYSGAEIMKLDSSLLAVTAAIARDHVVWNTHLEVVKSFDTQTWETVTLGASYNPDFSQPVSADADFAAYAQRSSGAGTRIIVHRFSSGTDTMFSGGTWNTSPSVNMGQLAWVASDSESEHAESSIYYFDGQSARNLSGITASSCRQPVLRDGEVMWMESNPLGWRVRLFTGDSVITLAGPGTSSEICAGYDESDGFAIAGVQDTMTGRGRIVLFTPETGSRLTIPDSDGIWGPHTDNGLVVWQSGKGAGRHLKTYVVQTAVTQDLGAAILPVVDDDRIAWTFGDAVEMYVPVTYRQVTTDGMNGWEQTKFKTIDSTHLVWGNYANSSKMRFFYSDGAATTELMDSSVYKDLVMANDGYVIWRVNFDSLYYFDGIHPPVKYLDTVQAENPYVAGGSIGFFGLRLTVNENIKRAWLYDIGSRRLTMLTTDSSNNWNVLCDGNTACWLNLTSGRLMYYNGLSTIPLSDSMAGSDYSYRNGRIVWSESRNGVWQIMMYSVASQSKLQLTNGQNSMTYPLTDGSHVVWFENPGYPLPSSETVMWYYDVALARSWRVAHVEYPRTFWNWMTGGKIAWAQNGTIMVYDGNVITQLTDDSFQQADGLYLDRGNLIWRTTPDPSANNNGNIFTGKLHAHADFVASNIAGTPPLAVSFVNQSWEGSESSSWNFGDGSSSTFADPTHTYLMPGKYSVTLSVTGPSGVSTEKKAQLIRVLQSTDVATDQSRLPSRNDLLQNYPNPFNPSTVISYRLSAAAFVTVKVYDVLGRQVGALVSEVQTPGAHAVTWNASRYASGMYFYQLHAGSFVQTRKLLLLK